MSIKYAHVCERDDKPLSGGRRMAAKNGGHVSRPVRTIQNAPSC